MGRFLMVLIVGGGALVFFGGREYLVSSGASSDPVEVDLAKLEAGETPENNHVKIGEHVSLYPASVYEYQQSKYASGEPGPDTTVTHSYYPILSMEHPFIQKLVETEGEDVPDITDFAVLVKTKRFKTIRAIPDEMNTCASVQGLVINRIDSLDSEEKKLIKESFPLVKLDNVLILEEGRKPASLLLSLGMIFGGVALVVAGIGAFVVKNRQTA
ncbi:MAG TPA: hypothetical protein VMY42_07565 [Thermoguttaceae bacterium]|nr:hypothetical protein [Thermoguttaceae bacterium]